MDENKVETKASGNSMGLIVVMVVIGIVAVAGFIFMNNKKVQTDNANVVVDSDTDTVEDQNINTNLYEDSEPMIDESGAPEPVRNAEDLTMPAEENIVTFDVKGDDFKFMPQTMTVKLGSKVKINFENTAGFHDFVLDEFNVATEKLTAGGTAMVEFVADKVGSFEYYCSVGQHRANGMVGTIIVTE